MDRPARLNGLRRALALWARLDIVGALLLSFGASG
jgi:hypothetical protein